MRKSLLLFMILLSNVSFAYTGNQEVISINSTDVATTPKAKAINEIRSRIKNKYQLDIKLNSEQKYLEKNELEALELGLTNIIVISTNTMVQKYGLRDLDIFEIPFIFNGLNEFNKFNTSLVSEEILKEVNNKNKNLYGLSFWAKNYKQIESQTGIPNYQSLKNKSFLLPATEINNTTSLIFNPNNQSKASADEIQDNNKTNSAPSTMLSIPDFNKSKNFESNRNILLTYHGLDVDIVLVNKRWFNKLSTDVQLGIIEIIKNVGLEEQAAMLIENKNLINDLKGRKFEVKQITPSDRALFKKEMSPVHRYYYNYINKDLLVKIYNLFK